jgi:hypothetical protein
MRYTKPQITNTAKAHQLVQGSDKGQIVDDNGSEPGRCTAAAYEADE